MKFPLGLTLAISATTLCSSFQLQGGTVTNTADSGPGSLRAAISAATAGEIIGFNFQLSGATIVLTTGELSITALQVTIDASSLPNGIRISGNNNSRILNISENANVSLISLELVNGRTLGGNGGGILALQSQLNCVDLTIRNCFATFDGGGLWANGVTGSINRCSFNGNDSGSFGGGIFLIGTTSCTIQNSVISGNRSVVGGGIANLSASPSIINCTIQGNSGVGIQLEFSSAPNLRNTIVWGNRASDGSIASQQIRKGNSSTAEANVNYSLVEGVSSTLNNRDGTLPSNAPQFIRPANPANAPTIDFIDLRVATTSPVLNVGDNSSVSSSLDRAAKVRIQNTTVDLGAYEGGYVTFAILHPLLSPSGDVNQNGLSNFLEYALGINPTATNNPTSTPTFSTSGGINYLTSFQRTNGADLKSLWETSTDLQAFSWKVMIAGIDYTVDSTSTISPVRQQLVFRLLPGGARRFYRQAFSTTN